MALTARSTLIKPAPAQMSVWGGFSCVKFDAIGKAADSKISLIASETSFVFPLACKTKAAEPATNGAGENARNQPRVYGRAN